MIGDEFTCDDCGGVFNKTRSEEDVREEFEGVFEEYIDLPDEDLAIVCDDCWKKYQTTLN